MKLLSAWLWCIFIGWPRSAALNFYVWAWEALHPCNDPGCPICAAKRRKP
jgi:hypothetical protein